MGKNLFYPKIETLFKRDPKTFKVIEGKLRLEEFRNIKEWFATEKIHGDNVSTCYRPTTKLTEQLGAMTFEKDVEMEVIYNGRSDKAQIRPPVLDFMKKTFTKEKFERAFPDVTSSSVIRIFGEAYGPGIQKGGGNYRNYDVSIRVFDVWVSSDSPDNAFPGWWLNLNNIKDVASKFGLKPVPFIAAHASIDDIVGYLKNGFYSNVASQEKHIVHKAEGVVARTWPMLFTRKGKRLMWKLKVKDFA